jgi:serine/threonine-protein kinase
VAPPARPPARGAFSRPIAAEPDETEEDPLEKTQPVRRAPGGFRPTAIPDEAESETAGTEEREVTLPSARAQLSPAAQAELAKQRRSWGGWLFLVLLLAAVGAVFYHPPTRDRLTPLFATALERLKGEELPLGPPAAEPLPVPQTSPLEAQAAGEGTQTPEPTPQPVAEQASVVAQAAESTPEPTRATSKRTRKSADAAPESKPKAAAPAKPATADAEPPVDGEPEIIDTRTAKGAAKAELGWLTLRTIPRAAVFDGENQLGTTPLRKVPLPVDTYRLLVVDPDGVNKMLSVPIKPGQVTDMTVRISDLPDWQAQ